MDQFNFSTKILIGGDALRAMLKNMRRVFIVTDSFMASSGRTAYLTEPLHAAGAEFRIYSKVGPDPDTQMVTDGVSVILDFKPDAVVAFGGGSPIDAAKAIMYFASRQFDLRDCPFIAIPTTAGTGSEVTDYAVITDVDTGTKIPLSESMMIDLPAPVSPVNTLSPAENSTSAHSMTAIFSMWSVLSITAWPQFPGRNPAPPAHRAWRETRYRLPRAFRQDWGHPDCRAWMPRRSPDRAVCE